MYILPALHLFSVTFVRIAYLYASGCTNMRFVLIRSSKPDIGGSEDDESSMCAEEGNPEFLQPGCYRSFCLEIGKLSL